MKKNGSRNANASVAKNTAMKMFSMPFCAYFVQISTTFLLSSTLALVTPSSLMLALMNSTARYAPVVTACVEARVQQRKMIDVRRQSVGQRHDDRENHRRRANHRGADQYWLGCGFERIARAIVR